MTQPPTSNIAGDVPSKVAEVLERAAVRLSKPGAWTRGANARNAAGRNLHTGRASDAVSWCVRGALSAEGRLPEIEAAEHVLRCAVSTSVTAWNDAPERTQSEVVAKLREAAAKARGETP